MAERKRDEMSMNITTTARFGGVATAAAVSVPEAIGARKAPKRPARPVDGVDRHALRDKVMAKFPNIRARLAE
ncbi:hypothetical protein [Salinarimonas sp.]|uniref:hypothetical protein n=1 Tax=Salinarimonas sp. TaxID=2766526 RepID=UPI0032D8B7D9